MIVPRSLTRRFGMVALGVFLVLGVPVNSMADTQRPVSKSTRLQADKTQTYWLTHKEGSGLVRGEEEEPISAPVFNLLWPLTKGRRLEKTRRLLGRWEVDEFLGRLAGLWIAEIELENEAEDVYMPESIADKVLVEITEDNSFNTYNLSKLDAPPPRP